MANKTVEEFEDIGEYPLSWKPGQGTTIVGRLLGYSVAKTPDGEAPLCVVDDRKLGPVTVWLDNFVLLHQFNRLEPSIGDLIMLRCIEEDSGAIAPNLLVIVESGPSESAVDPPGDSEILIFSKVA